MEIDGQNPPLVELGLPKDLGGEGLLVGYSLEQEHARIPAGFSFGPEPPVKDTSNLDPYLFHGEGHLMTVAPTGSGKGVSCVIPAALRHEGDLVVIDPKGENFAVTARRRRHLGQEICLIDPFGVTARHEVRQVEPGGINFFELLPFLADTDQAAAQGLAGLLIQDGPDSASDKFWHLSAVNILTGLIDFYANDPDGGTIADLLEDLNSFPREPNTLSKFRSRMVRSLEKFPEISEILRKFRLLPEHVEMAYFEHERLQRGETRTRRVFTPEEQLSAFLTTGDEIPFDDLEVYIENRTFSRAIRDSSGVEPDERSIRILFDFVRSFPAKDEDLEMKQKRVRKYLHAAKSQDISYPTAILKMMSSQRSLPQRVAAMISGTPDRTWGSMLTVLQNNLGHLNSEGVRQAISHTTLDLDRFRQGTGTSVYIVFPPHRLASHSQLLASLFRGLVNILVAREVKPEKNTLFLMDEVAQLGHLRDFIVAKTLLRGYGVQIWSFWQDLSQLQKLYPDVWPTIINNCKVFQAFGCATPLMAADLDQIFDIPRDVILDLEEDEMLLSIYGDDPVIARKPKYFSDPAFNGKFDENPLTRQAGNSIPPGASRHSKPNRPVRGFTYDIRSKKKIAQAGKA